ncbi:glycosyltransferase involved in cell wall biosynthesis [Bradyrhizobium sp. LM2.7]
MASAGAVRAETVPLRERRGTVLFVSHEASRSGAPVMLLNFMRWFVRTHDVRLRILAGGRGELLPEFNELGEVHCFDIERGLAHHILDRFKLYPSSLSSEKVARHRWALRQELAKSDVRVVYANSAGSARMVQFLSFLDCPVICHVHELEMSIRALGTPDFDTMDVLKRRVSAYVTVSDAAKANLVERHGVPADKIEVVPGLGPVPNLKATAAQCDVRGQLGIPEGAQIACGCGSIEARKGTDLFLEVAAHVAGGRHNNPVHFIWVGGQHDRVNSMRKRVASLGLQGLVHFVGPKPDVTPYFDASELLLLTSREESLSLVMLEAALREKPTICFDNSGHPPEFVRSGAGIVVDGFDPKLMAANLVDILSKPGLRKKMGKIARQRALERYDFNAGAARIGSIIDNVLRP